MLVTIILLVLAKKYIVGTFRRTIYFFGINYIFLW